MSTDVALRLAMVKADGDQWEAMEEYYQQTQRVRDYRVDTCVCLRFDRATLTVTEYHRNLGSEAHWWRKERPAFAEAQP